MSTLDNSKNSFLGVHYVHRLQIWHADCLNVNRRAQCGSVKGAKRGSIKCALVMNCLGFSSSPVCNRVRFIVAVHSTLALNLKNPLTLVKKRSALFHKNQIKHRLNWKHNRALVKRRSGTKEMSMFRLFVKVDTEVKNTRVDAQIGISPTWPSKHWRTSKSIYSR